MNKLKYISTLCVYSSLLFCTACVMGVKDWPEADAQEEKYHWLTVAASISGDCLLLEARMAGAYQNFSFAEVLLEPMDENACANCPFNPRYKTRFAPGDKELEINDSLIKIYLCKMDTNIPYRLVLKGANRVDGINKVSSQVITVIP